MQKHYSHPCIQLGLLALLLASSLGIAGAPLLQAQAAGKVQFFHNEMKVGLPYGLIFTITARADERIETLALEYGTNALSCVRSVARQPVEIEAGFEVDGEWQWDFIQSGSLPMGAELWWEWEATLANGETARSPRQTKTLIDNNFTWEQTGLDPEDPTSVNLWYHDTGKAFALSLAKIGQQALQRMQEDFGFTPSRPVKIILYNGAEEVFNSGLYFTEWVGGYASLEYGLIVIGVDEGDYDWGEEVITHEMGHLVSGQLSANCLAVSVPTWLAEGFSMYVGGGVIRSEQAKVKQALAAGTLPPLRTLAAGFSAISAEAAISYSQSGMVFDFMMQAYGPEKVVAVFQAIQAGTLAEDALRQVIGLNVDGLDNAWRASLGFAAPEAQATATSTPLPSAVPTLPLLAPYDASPTPTASPPPPTPTPPPVTPTAEPAPTEVLAEAEPGKPPCAGSSAMILGVFLAVMLTPAIRKGKLS